MKKGTKLFFGILMASMMLGTVAFANTGEFKFYFSPGLRLSSDKELKSDNEQRAYVTTVASNLIPSNGIYRGDDGVHGRIWFRVRCANENFASEVKSITEPTKITLNYINTVSAGASYYLKGQQDSADAQRVKAFGKWTP